MSPVAQFTDRERARLGHRARSPHSDHAPHPSVFVATAVARQLVGLRQESEWRWSARFFDVDLGTLEILPIAHAFSGGSVMETVTTVRAAEPARGHASVSA